jgi:hypothetical protein
MRASSIRPHLRRYSIRGRGSTINNAFAAAIAPRDVYEPTRLAAALKLLGQVDPDNLTCVYCGAQAETWDHLFPLVQKRVLSGYGHTLGNLVPSCTLCNTQKRGEDWVLWTASAKVPRARIESIRRYAASLAAPRWTYAELRQHYPALMNSYERELAVILAAMSRADKIAAEILAAANERCLKR